VGAQAKLKASRRALRREESTRLKAFYEECMQRPDLQADLAAQAADTELQDLVASMLPGQETRLQAAGFRRRMGGYDGAGMWDSHRQRMRVVHAAHRETDGRIWGHVSVSSADGTLPSWYYVRNAQWLLYPDHAGIIVVAPGSRHVNLSEVAHVWTCLTGDVVPDFGRFGTI